MRVFMFGTHSMWSSPRSSPLRDSHAPSRTRNRQFFELRMLWERL
jgi:hypothetical protein